MPNKSLRVLSYNIHKGFTAGRGKFVLEKIKDAISLVKADIVFLQEVLGEHSEHKRNLADWPAIPQFNYLADKLWPHVVYGKNAVYEEGHHGNAILSKFPVLFHEKIDVSAHRFEQRGLLHVVVNVPKIQCPLHVLCVHFGLTRRGRDFQIDLLLNRVKKFIPNADPLIIAGDFNDWTERATRKLEELAGVHEVFFRRYGAHARTFPSNMPFLKLDRIYCRGFSTLRAEVLTGLPWSSLSDHAAVFAELELLRKYNSHQ